MPLPRGHTVALWAALLAGSAAAEDRDDPPAPRPPSDAATAVDALALALADLDRSPDPVARRGAVVFLASLSAPEPAAKSWRPLLTAARQDADLDVRLLCLAGIARLAPELEPACGGSLAEAAETAADLLADRDADEDLRLAAADCLARLAEAERRRLGTDRPTDPDAAPGDPVAPAESLARVALAGRFDDRTDAPGLRGAALGHFRVLDGSAASAPVFLRLIAERGDHPSVRAAALRAVGTTDADPEAVTPALLAALRDAREPVAVRIAAAAALGDFGDKPPEVLAALKSLAALNGPRSGRSRGAGDGLAAAAAESLRRLSYARRIVVIVDASDSMREVSANARQQAAAWVRRLSPERRFNVLAFSERRVASALPKPGRAVEGRRAAAARFLTAAPTFGACDPRPAFREAVRQGADLIVLYSAGAFPDGFVPDIMREVASAGVRVNVVGFAADPDAVARLKRLAETNRGRYFGVAQAKP
jgi:hypothetical protein